MSAKQRKRTAELTRAQKEIDEHKYQVYCECNHCNDGVYSIVKTGKYTAGGEQIFMCKDCQHEVRIGRLDYDKLKEACDSILSACDIIKMHLGPDDDKLKLMAARLQMTMPKFLKTYSQVVKRVEQKKEVRERRSTGGRASTYYSGVGTSVYNRTNSNRRGR